MKKARAFEPDATLPRPGSRPSRWPRLTQAVIEVGQRIGPGRQKRKAPSPGRQSGGACSTPPRLCPSVYMSRHQGSGLRPVEVPSVR